MDDRYLNNETENPMDNRCRSRNTYKALFYLYFVYDFVPISEVEEHLAIIFEFLFTNFSTGPIQDLGKNRNELYRFPGRKM